MYEFISFLLLLLLHWLYRRISFNKSKSNEGPDKVGACSQQEQEPSGLHITDLPPEALALIFEHCPYDVLARRVRLVCLRFCDVTTLVLNCGFLTLGPKIDRAMVNAGSRFKEGRTVEERLVISHPFSSDMVADLYRTGQCRPTEQLLMDQHYIALMILKFEYRALRAVTWRHIHRPYSGSGHLAYFYAGSLLDEFLRFLRVARHSPTLLGLAMLNQDNGNEVIKLCIQYSKFMKHFRKRTETFERDYSISGAKIIDLCYGLFEEHERMTPHEQAVTVNGTECHIEADYRMPYTWFNCLPSSHAQPNQRSEDRSSIYLRMRQLINGRNHFFLEKIHHEKELLIRKPPYMLILKYIVPSLYNGLHQNYGYLFFYGNMDRSAFHEVRSPTVRLFDYFNLDFFTSHNETDVPESSNVGLNIDIEFQSLLRLAPIQFSDNSVVHISKPNVVVNGYRQIRFR